MREEMKHLRVQGHPEKLHAIERRKRNRTSRRGKGHPEASTPHLDGGGRQFAFEQRSITSFLQIGLGWEVHSGEENVCDFP